MVTSGIRAARISRPLGTLCVCVALLLLNAENRVRAAVIATGNPDLKLNWDNTFKYTSLFRLANPDSALTADVNQDDGDRNFSRGLVSNRVDFFSEADLTFKDNFGMRASVAAWYDSVYNQKNDNESPATANQLSVASNSPRP